VGTSVEKPRETLPKQKQAVSYLNGIRRCALCKADSQRMPVVDAQLGEVGMWLDRRPRR
jgi:hypothetical protein